MPSFWNTSGVVLPCEKDQKQKGSNEEDLWKQNNSHMNNWRCLLQKK